MSQDVDERLSASQSMSSAAVSRVVHDVQETVIESSENGSTVVVVPSLDQVETTVSQLKQEKLDESEEGHVDVSNVQIQSSPREFVIKHVVPTATLEQKPTSPIEIQLPQQIQQAIQQQIPQGELQMGNVLAAIASHLAKTRKMTAEEQVVHLQEAQAGNSDSSPIIVTVPANTTVSQSVPSSSHDITVSSEDSVTSEQIIQTVSSSSDLPLTKRPRIEIADSSQEQSGPVYIRADKLPPGTYLQTIETDNGIFHVTQVATVDTSKPASALTEIYGPCPICGDRISGNRLKTSIVSELFCAPTNAIVWGFVI